jgi:hypothetical protein
MPSFRTSLRAKCSSSNSPETDRMSEVLHDVSVRNEEGIFETVRLMAADPLDAMDRVRIMDTSLYNSLPRVN